MKIVAKFKKRFYFTAAKYFKFFANWSLKRWHPRVIAVTGSAGKTTMLSLIEAQLGNRAHYSHNANSAFGIAFDILGMRGITGSKLHWISLILKTPWRGLRFRHREKFYVVEIDGERPHETEFIAEWLKPEVTIWVSLGRSHAVFYEQEVASGKFKDVDEAIAHEFATLPLCTRKLVLIDDDNPSMVESVKGIRAKVLGVSKSMVDSYTVYPNHAEFKLGKNHFSFKNPVPKDIGIQLAMLIKLMDYLKLPIDYEMGNFQMPPGRSNYLLGEKGIKIIDSSYNAHIISMASVLEMAKSLRASHKWLVIGDIIDQGSIEASEHEKLAHLILEAKPERVILVGRRTAKYTYPLLKGEIAVESFKKPQEALRYLKKSISGQETLIFKGSQYLEWIIEKLLANPEDIVQLPRQDLAHKKRRASWGLK